MSLSRFRFIDLFFFGFLAVVFEILSSVLFTDAEAGFRFSFSFLIYVIASIRWGWRAVFIYIAVGVVNFMVNSQLPDTATFMDGFLLYLIGNAFAVLPILIFGKRDRNLIVSQVMWAVLYAFLVLLSLSLGKGLMVLIIEGDALGFQDYFASMLLTFVVSLIFVVVFCNFKTELMIDMERYLESQVGSEE